MFDSDVIKEDDKCVSNTRDSTLYEIVVAHYNEDLRWLSNYPTHTLQVYSKGNLSNIPCIQHTLPNIGREAHTYLQYIINRYDTLPQLVLFTQGRISDHGDPFKNIFYETSSKHHQIKLYADKYSSPPSTFTGFMAGLNESYRLPFWKTHTNPSKYSGDEWFRKYVNKDIDLLGEIKIFWNAIFLVRKEAILTRSKDYYISLLDDLQSVNPEAAHYFERSWYYIFNLDKF